MSRLWIGFVAACGVIAGTAFACQPGKAAEPVSGHAAVKNAESSKALFAAAPLQPQKPTAGTPDAKPSAEPLTVLKSGPDHIRVVCRLKNHPVTNVNQVLQQLFHLEGGLHKLATASAKGAASSNVAIVPDPITNSLLISGTPEAVEEVQGLLVKLDQPAGMVLLEVEIGTLPVGEAKPVESLPSKEKSPAAKDEPFRLPQRPEKMETTACVRLMTLDNQPAFVHVGSRVPACRQPDGLVARWRDAVDDPGQRGSDRGRHAEDRPRRGGCDADRTSSNPNWGLRTRVPRYWPPDAT